MAISVRLPSGKGPYIEHYLIQATADNRLALESSDNKFDSIPMLIAHYAQCWWDINRLLWPLLQCKNFLKKTHARHIIFYLHRFSDELPVQLMLPKAIQEAKNRQQLSSLALLGQGRLFCICQRFVSSRSLLICNTCFSQNSGDILWLVQGVLRHWIYRQMTNLPRGH